MLWLGSGQETEQFHGGTVFKVVEGKVFNSVAGLRDPPGDAEGSQGLVERVQTLLTQKDREVAE